MSEWQPDDFLDETNHRKARAMLILFRAIGDVKRDSTVTLTDEDVLKIWGLAPRSAVQRTYSVNDEEVRPFPVPPAPSE